MSPPIIGYFQGKQDLVVLAWNPPRRKAVNQDKDANKLLNFLYSFLFLTVTKLLLGLGVQEDKNQNIVLDQFLKLYHHQSMSDPSYWSSVESQLSVLICIKAPVVSTSHIS